MLKPEIGQNPNVNTRGKQKQQEEIKVVRGLLHRITMTIDRGEMTANIYLSGRVSALQLEITNR